MEELLVNGKVVSFNNPNQIINMGGPWVGTLFIGDNEISKNVIIDNFFYNINLERLYYVKYNALSKWEKENYFSINYIDFLAREIYTYDLKFKMAFLKEISNDNKLMYYDAFHDKDESKLKEINLNEVKIITLPGNVPN